MKESAKKRPPTLQKRFDKLLGRLVVASEKDSTEEFMGTRVLESGFTFFRPKEPDSPYSSSMAHGDLRVKRTELASGVEEERRHAAILALIKLEKISRNSNLSEPQE